MEGKIPNLQDLQVALDRTRENTEQRYPYRFRVGYEEHTRTELFRASDIPEALRICYEMTVRERGRDYIPSPDLESIIGGVGYWLTERHGKPGLLLYGGVGNGKTTLLKAIKRLIYTIHGQRNYSEELLIESAIDVCRRAAHEGESWEKLMQKKLLAIDDLGLEPTVVMNYGTELTPLTTLLHKRYEWQSFTIITTNLDDEQLERRYDQRTMDRIYEQYDTVFFDFPSFRRQ